jgi:hypothetical protein
MVFFGGKVIAGDLFAYYGHVMILKRCLASNPECCRTLLVPKKPYNFVILNIDNKIHLVRKYYNKQNLFLHF